MKIFKKLTVEYYYLPKMLKELHLTKKPAIIFKPLFEWENLVTGYFSPSFGTYIYININYSLKSIRSTLLHELRHYWQYEKRILKIHKDSFKWKNKYYSSWQNAPQDFAALPWEKDAITWENKRGNYWNTSRNFTKEETQKRGNPYGINRNN